MKIFKSTQDIKVGVIGYGGAFNMGKQHLDEMAEAGMTPFAVAEIAEDRRAAAREDFPDIETYASVEEMLKTSDVDLITIITPHNTHAPLGLECLQAGKHVVTEKPFTITTEQCDALIAEAQKHGVLLSTYHNRHWDGLVLRANEQVREQKVIGEVYRVEAHMGAHSMPKDWWRSSKSISGGVLYDWGVHLLEYSLQVLGDRKIIEVSGFAKTGYWAGQAPDSYPWKNDAIEDEANAVVRFEDGAMLTLTISHLVTHPRPGAIEFFGTRGAYIADQKTWTTHIAQGPSAAGKGTIFGQGQEIVENTGENPPAQGKKFYQNIAAHLTGDAELIITPQWARRPIHILDLANQSARQGKTLAAKYG